jgi:16S rRNA (cytosine1402-N4)-methyltransferase
MNLQPVPELQHRTVLLEEAVDALAWKASAPTAFTWTAPSAAAVIAAPSCPGWAARRLIAFDKDPQAIATAQKIDDARFRSCTTASRPWMRRWPHAALRRSTAY